MQEEITRREQVSFCHLLEYGGEGSREINSQKYFSNLFCAIELLVQKYATKFPCRSNMEMDLCDGVYLVVRSLPSYLAVTGRRTMGAKTVSLHAPRFPPFYMVQELSITLGGRTWLHGRDAPKNTSTKIQSVSPRAPNVKDKTIKRPKNGFLRGRTQVWVRPHGGNRHWAGRYDKTWVEFSKPIFLNQWM